MLIYFYWGGQPSLSGYLTMPHGWPLNGGSTVDDWWWKYTLINGQTPIYPNTKIFPSQSPIIIISRKWTSWRGTLRCTKNRNTVKKDKQTNKQTKKTKGKIPICRVENRRNTDTAFKIGHAYLKLYPSRVFVVSQACIHEKSTSAIAARKRETCNWSTQWSKSLVIGCPTNFIIDKLSEIV